MKQALYHVSLQLTAVSETAIVTSNIHDYNVLAVSADDALSAAKMGAAYFLRTVFSHAKETRVELVEIHKINENVNLMSDAYSNLNTRVGLYGENVIR